MKTRDASFLLALGLILASSSPARGAETSLDGIDSLASPAVGPRSAEPSLAVAPDGTVWISWISQSARASDRRPPFVSLMTSRLSGGHWLPGQPVIRNDALFVNWADPPVLIATSREVAVIAYPWKRAGDGYSYDLHASFTSTSGAVWTKPVVLNRDGKAAEHGFVSLAPSGDGVEVMWLDGRKLAKPKPGHEAEGNMTVRAARLDARGELAREVEIDGRACDCCNTAAIAVPGGTLIAFRDRDKEETRDIAVARLEAGKWSAPTTLHADGWKISGCPVNGPALDAKESRVAAAWFTMVGEQAKVLVAFSADAGRHFSAPIAVTAGDPLGRVDVALTADGSALVSWLEALGHDALFRVQRIWATGSQAEPVIVARVSASRSSGFPKMVVSGDRAYFAWVEAQPDGRLALKTASARIP